jgi:hypothetical protein
MNRNRQWRLRVAGVLAASLALTLTSSGAVAVAGSPPGAAPGHAYDPIVGSATAGAFALLSRRRKTTGKKTRKERA